MISTNYPTKVPSRSYMAVNVILTFHTSDDFDDPHEMFDVKLPVSRHEENAVEFLIKKFFPRIVTQCRKRQRDPRRLIKISTCSDWGVFEAMTQKAALSTFDHPCKWYFGRGRDDLDGWEKALMRDFQFGADADMSFMNTIRKMYESGPSSDVLV
jgi:hypothetical protein